MKEQAYYCKQCNATYRANARRCPQCRQYLTEQLSQDKLAEKWTIARGVIEHAHTMVHQLLTWNIAMEGFVFSIFALITKQALEQENAEVKRMLWTSDYVLCVVGILVAWTFMPPLLKLAEHLQVTKAWWQKQGSAEQLDDFPSVEIDRTVSLYGLPIITTIAWLIAAFYVWWGLSLVPTGTP